ncbi:MAG: hypothetical protein K9M13_03275 [Simkaniaceae bacterium]|nr:hypothetical protein [Simkaniaceae bacterium]
MMNSHQDQQTKVYKEITPPAGPNVDNGVGFSIFADYILWEARAGDTAFATSGIAQDATAGQANLSRGTVYTPGFKYQSGFKVGLSAMLGHDNWDLEAQYIWLHSNDKKTTLTTTTNAESTYAPIWMTQPDSTELIGGDGRWNMRYNVVQLNLGRNFLVSENLSFRPYYGIRGAWVHQNNITNYTFATSEDVLSNFNINQKQNWWGVGFQTGTDAGFWFDENWAIYANFGTSLMWGKYSFTNKQKNTTSEDSQPYTENWNGTEYGVQPTLDLEMGFRWQMCFDDNTYAFLLQAGWEQQVWINHIKFSNASQDDGDLSIQGFNIRARFFF